MIEKVQTRGQVVAAPHTYVVADIAYKSLRRFRRGQSILISGESGAGKTETTKHALTYLSEVAGGTFGVEQKVLSMNPLLEAFGNAKTLRNNNSSRFGKLMCLAFDKTFEISGCSTESYLLEKSRVVYQGGAERNFHIFYMLCLSPECIKNFGLDKAEAFRYLNTSGCIAIEGVDDHEELKAMIRALNGLGFTDEQRNNVFSVTAAILHLGNVEFESATEGEGSKVTAGSKFSIGQAARLLHVDEASLVKALGELNYTIRGENVCVQFNAAKAADARDALGKALYGNQFDWIVDRANDAMRPPGGVDTSRMIAILGGLRGGGGVRKETKRERAKKKVVEKID
jgi:myosin heavy subunit